MSDNLRKTIFKRKFISLEEKIKILDRILKGEKPAHIAKSLSLNEATVRTIRKNEKEIRNAVFAGSPISAKYASRTRAPIIEKMEKALSIWIDNKGQKKIPLNGNVIKQKALKIYQTLKENGEPSTNQNFVASTGWFENFKKRFAIHSIKIQGDNSSSNQESGRTYVYNNEMDGILEIARSMRGENFMGGVDMAIDNVQDFLMEEKVCESTLVEMTSEEENQIDLKTNATDNCCKANDFTLKSIKEGLAMSKNLELFFLNSDPSAERSHKFQKDLQNSMSPYHKIYNDLLIESKQPKITEFFKKGIGVRNPNENAKCLDSKDGIVKLKNPTR